MLRFLRRQDDRSERIVRDLALWVATLRERPKSEPYRLALCVAEEMLFDAVLIHYRGQTEHMTAGDAVGWLRSRAERLMAERMDSRGGQ